MPSTRLILSNALEHATSGLDQLMETTGLSSSTFHIPLDSAKAHKCLSKLYLVPLKGDSVEDGPLRGRLMKQVMVWFTFIRW
jgi:hypothetical protein